MRRIAMILILLLGGGAIACSVIGAADDDTTRIYAPGIGQTPVKSLFSADDERDDDPPPVPINPADPHAVSTGGDVARDAVLE